MLLSTGSIILNITLSNSSSRLYDVGFSYFDCPDEFVLRKLVFLKYWFYKSRWYCKLIVHRFIIFYPFGVCTNNRLFEANQFYSWQPWWASNFPLLASHSPWEHLTILGLYFLVWDKRARYIWGSGYFSILSYSLMDRTITMHKKFWDASVEY